MVEAVLSDMKAFLILLVYSCLAYSFIFHTLNDMDHFSESLFIGFALSLGDFHKGDFANTTVYIIFALGSLLILIVMMNLLIAIISDSFDRVQNSMNIFDNLLKIDLILEVYKFMWWRAEYTKSLFL